MGCVWGTVGHAVPRGCKGRLWLPMSELLVGQSMRSGVSFTMRVVKPWHTLPREAMDAPSLETLKVRLDSALSNLI